MCPGKWYSLTLILHDNGTRMKVNLHFGLFSLELQTLFLPDPLEKTSPSQMMDVQ